MEENNTTPPVEPESVPVNTTEVPVEEPGEPKHAISPKEYVFSLLFSIAFGLLTFALLLLVGYLFDRIDSTHKDGWAFLGWVAIDILVSVISIFIYLGISIYFKSRLKISFYILFVLVILAFVYQFMDRA